MVARLSTQYLESRGSKIVSSRPLWDTQRVSDLVNQWVRVELSAKRDLLIVCKALGSASTLQQCMHVCVCARARAHVHMCVHVSLNKRIK